MNTKYKQIILERLRLLKEDAKRDVIDFLESIKGYKYTKIEVSLKGYFTSRLYLDNVAYDYDQSTLIEIIPNLKFGGQEIQFINLKEPISQQVIDAVDDAVSKQFPSFERYSGNIDGFIQWVDKSQQDGSTNNNEPTDSDDNSPIDRDLEDNI